MNTNWRNGVYKLGWTTETSITREWNETRTLYRAFQGGFKTLWRDTPGEVLRDVQAIAEARKQPSSAPF